MTGRLMLDGLSEGNVESIEANIDAIVRGLGCGFGGGACLSMPFNWAPLAPGTAPTVLGFPTDSLTTGEGLPVFSALNWKKIGKVCVPMPWPPAKGYPGCFGSAAGGWLGDKGPTNFFRLYITPTITGAVGAAACFNVVPMVSGRIPPPGVSPVVPGGNCVVAATPLFGCKDDGSDGDFRSLGYGNYDGFLNANACVPETGSDEYTRGEREMISRYVRGERANSSLLDGILTAYQRAPVATRKRTGPLVGIGLASGQNPNFEVGIDPAALKRFDTGNIVKIKLGRVSAFPDFIMDWVNRQAEEVVNKLTSLPTLYVILPDMSRIYESGWNGFTDNLRAKLKQGEAGYKNRSFDVGSGGPLSGSRAEANRILAEKSGTLNRVGRSISGLKAAYEFLGSLPIIKLENETVMIDVPMISEEDGDKLLANVGKAAESWKREIATKKEAWRAAGHNPDDQVFVDAEATLASLNEWVRFTENAKRFPDKLYRYMTWKQRYASQILCNVEQIERMLGGYIADNGKRFRAWVEMVVLLKAVLKSWQLMIDLFYDHTAQCGVCRNERYDLKHFVFKIVSAVIPKIPIITFPKWPDIILDLHNLRLGLRILMPEFDYRFHPVVLPTFPKLLLPDVPRLGFSLPSIPRPPKFPELPELPDIPSLPVVNLPDLPPPPKIPKLFAAIEGVLQILKLVSKILCILRLNPFVPEWRAGDQIAQITERQGKLPIDFLDIEYPNFSMGFLDAIRVNTLVNLEFQVDYILEMAKSGVEPVNRFSGDVRNLNGAVNRAVRETKGATDFRNVVPQGTTTVPVGERQMMAPEKRERTDLFAVLAYSLAVAFRDFLGDTQSKAGEAVDVAAFAADVRSEAAKLLASADPKERAIAETLGRAAAYGKTSTAEDRLAAALAADNARKFGIVKEAVRAEIRETEILQAQIAKSVERSSKTPEIPGILAATAGTPTTNAALAAQTVGTESFAERGKPLEAFAEKAADAYVRLANGEEETELRNLEREGANVLGRIREGTESASEKETELRADDRELLAFVDPSRLVDARLEFSATSETVRLAASESPTTGANSGGAGFGFRYSGIYALDEGRRTRLFDYLDETDGTEEAVLIDTTGSGEGKKDVVYRIGTGLFFKKNLKRAAAAVSTENVRTLGMSDILDDASLVPSAPNFFRETSVNARRIGFSFAPADSGEWRFRLEYSDAIDAFDRLAQGDDVPESRRKFVDLLTDEASGPTLENQYPGSVLRKTAAYLFRASGDGWAKIPKFRTVGEGVSFTLSPGSVAYAGAGGAVLDSRIQSETGSVSVPMERNSSIESLTALELTVTDGELLIPTGLFEESDRNFGELRGTPLLPGTELSLDRPGNEIAVRYADGGEFELSGPAEYRTYDLGRKADSYSVSFESENGWRYARLSSEDPERTTTRASLELLSPQREADREGPDVTFPASYRIPVYLRDTVNLNRYVDDVSGVAEAFVDADPETDSDGNGNTRDDADSRSGALASGFASGTGTDWKTLAIGPFEKPETKRIVLTAIDENGNRSSREISVEAFVPIPSVTSADSASADGKTDVERPGIPVDLFRFRAGRLERLAGIPDTPETGTGGQFSFVFGTGSENLTLRRNGATIATVNERTGKITVADPSAYSVRVDAADSTRPMTFRVVGSDGRTVYSEAVALPASLAAEIGTLWPSDGKKGVFVKTSDPSRVVRSAPDATALPGGAFFVDSNAEAFAGIAADGNVYLLESGYSLSYGTDGLFPVVTILKADSSVVAEILYRLDAEFVIK